MDIHLGDTVLYVMPGSGADRPAIVVDLHPGNILDLQIFTNRFVDGIDENVIWKLGARYSGDGDIDTWHPRPDIKIEASASQPALGPPVEHPRFKAMRDRLEPPSLPSSEKICPQHGVKGCPQCFG